MSNIADLMIEKIDEVGKKQELPHEFLAGLGVIKEINSYYKEENNSLNIFDVQDFLDRVSKNCSLYYRETLNYLAYIVEKYSNLQNQD